MRYGSDEWRAKVLDPITALKWAIDEEDDDFDAMSFLRSFHTGDVFGPEWGEYRYWATGAHEPMTLESDEEVHDV